LDELTPEQFDRDFKTSIHAPFWIAKAALPNLRAGEQSPMPLCDAVAIFLGTPSRPAPF
jgi:NAD(P)-dependent dehydrogenase (short-subunit alcohol dehydrogenase family)